MAKKQKYVSVVQLGETYTDSKTQFTGYAESLSFFHNDCERVVLTKLNTLGDALVRIPFDVRALTAPSDGPTFTYRSDIQLGEFYQDTKLPDFEGFAEVITFHEHAQERVALHRSEHTMLGLKVRDTEHDAMTLKHIKSGKVARTDPERTGGPSRPVASRPPTVTR